MTSSVATRAANSLPLADLVATVAEVAANEHLWKPLVTIPAPGRDRWWTRIRADQNVDVWLLTWLPGHTTELHDHGPSAAAFTVVSGKLHERRAHWPAKPTARVLEPGSVAWISPGTAHDVTGTGSVPAISIHAYSPPLTEMNFFDSKGRVVRSVVSSEPEEELDR